MAKSPEDEKILSQANHIVEQAFHEAETQPFMVTLPTNVAYYLEEQMRLLHGIYPPAAEEVAQVTERLKHEDASLDERDYMLLVSSKLRTMLPIDQTTGYVSQTAKQEETPVTIPLTLQDMDIINVYLDWEIVYSRKDLAAWFTQHKIDSEPEEIVEAERHVWRQVNFKANQKAYALLRQVNTAFLEAGAPPRPAYEKYFEGFSQD